MELTNIRPLAHVFTVFSIFVFNQVIGLTLGLDDVTGVIEFGKNVTLDVSQTWDLLARNQPLDDDIQWKKERVMMKFSELSDRINAFEENEKILDAMSFANIIRRLHQQNQLSNHLWELNKQITIMSRFYRSFDQYSKASERYEESTLKAFVWKCVAPHDGITESLEIIHSLIIPDKHGFENEHFLELLIDNLKLQEGFTAMCETQQSPQQSLYNMFNNIAIIEIKGYMMTQFSWLLLKIYEQSNFSEEMEQTRTRYETRMAETLEAVQTAMALANQDLWRCDSPYPNATGTNTELTQLIQGLIVNEVDLSDYQSCTANCAYYQYTEAHGCYDTDNCSKLRKCNGRVYNCRFIDSHMSVCPAKESRRRRYDYIRYDNEQEFGKKGTCPLGASTINSWYRWFVHCSYCLCLCDDDSTESDRYFNLREVVTDLDSNKVITGLKFVKVRQVIHLQIEQGELLERGRVANNTEWKPVDAYSPFDYSVEDGVDYLKLSWDKRVMDLDDLTAQPGYLVTGVRFRTLGSHLNFEIRITPFNFTTGVLGKTLAESTWHGNSNTDASENPRTVLNLDKPDRSTRSKLPSIPDSQSDQYIQFTPSDLDKDAAQSTVPFIDTQPVVPNPRIPIAGAGIYHKGRRGFGGYIAPKLRTYNFAPHLHTDGPVPRSDVQILENVIGTVQFN